jgi:hypothetical protein
MTNSNEAGLESKEQEFVELGSFGLCLSNSIALSGTKSKASEDVLKPLETSYLHLLKPFSHNSSQKVGVMLLVEYPTRTS